MICELLIKKRQTMLSNREWIDKLDKSFKRNEKKKRRMKKEW